MYQPVKLDALQDVAAAGPQRILPHSHRRLLREHAGLSRAAVAAVVGVSERTVAAWERGRQPHESVAPRYRRLLGHLYAERTTPTPA